MMTMDMPCMILAAGRGERMRPLTDHVPKPLLEIHGRSLLEHHLVRLRDAGYKNIVINHAWLGNLIEERLGNGTQLGVNIKYSPEQDALETAGGIATALPLLHPQDYFFVINGDVYSPDFPFGKLKGILENLRNDDANIEHQTNHPTRTLAYLFLVPNPEHHPRGDFFIRNSGQISADDTDNSLGDRYTFSGAGIYHKDLFSGLTTGVKAPLAPLLREAMGKGQVFGEILACPWHDVGTPERLEQLNQ